MLERTVLYDRTARAPYPSYRLSRRRRRWENVSWWLSSIFVVALLAWTLTWWFGIRGDDGSATASRVITFEVTSAESGQPVAGALVSYPGGRVATDGQGAVSLTFPAEPVDVEISASGFEPVYGTAGDDIDERQVIALQPQSSSSQVEQQSAETTSTDSGELLTTPVLVATPSSVSQVATDASGEVASISGTITDANGQPIWDATILSGSEFVRTGENGTFDLDNVPVGSDVLVWAPGYADQTVPSASLMNASMERHDIKGAFLTAGHLTDEVAIQHIIDLAQTTDVNAVVIDMKEGTVYYDTQVQFFDDADAVFPAFDPAELVQRFEAAGLYTIARIVVFNDPIVAENMPDLAVKTTDGQIWRGSNGDAWVNPYKQELWQPNIDLGIEAANMGFDEVQYDYVRFPSDGDLSNAEFGVEHTFQEDERVGAIVDFLSEARDQLAPHGVKMGADVFAIIAIYPDDQGIGQRFADFTKVVDYISPMAYPSHFTPEPLGMDEPPNAEPYQTLQITMASAVEKIPPGMVLKIRPWLQDFTVGDPPYGAKEVGDQIRATMEGGASGWMLWNPDSSFTVGALAPKGNDEIDSAG